MAGAVEAVQLVVLLEHRWIDVPPDAGRDGEVRRHLVGVAQVESNGLVVQPQIRALLSDGVSSGNAEEEISGIVTGLRHCLGIGVGAERGAFKSGRQAAEGGGAGNGALVWKQMLRLPHQRPSELKIMGVDDVVVVLLDAQNSAGEGAAVVAFRIRHEVAKGSYIGESNFAVRVGQAQLRCEIGLRAGRAGDRFGGLPSLRGGGFDEEIRLEHVRPTGD